MKTLLLITFFFYSFVSFGQKILVKGIAIDTTQNRHRVRVILNDTLTKYFSADLPKYNRHTEITKNKDLCVYTDENGKFEIKALPTDSLYFSSYEHIRESHLVRDLLNRKSIKIELKPKVCVEYIECKEKSHELYAFIGNKISVESSGYIYYCNIISMDSKYRAKYRVLENIYGDYPKDTINFISYDHSSIKKYSDFENVLIYVADYCGELTHVKYQYSPLYKTKDGKWASPYNPYDYKNIDSKFKIKPRKIEFEKPFEFNFNIENINQIQKRFPEPYCKISNGKVTVLYGNYPDELFELKKHKALKEFGFFK